MIVLIGGLTVPRDWAYGRKELMEAMIDLKVFFKGVSAESSFFGLPSSAGKEEGRRGVRSEVLGVACKSKVLMSNARSFVAASRIESTPIDKSINVSQENNEIN